MTTEEIKTDVYADVLKTASKKAVDFNGIKLHCEVKAEEVYFKQFSDAVETVRKKFGVDMDAKGMEKRLVVLAFLKAAEAINPPAPAKK
jgi:hypothetical protein